MPATDIASHPIHLGLGATADIEPLFTGEMAWYADNATRHANDGAEGRLMGLHVFTESWDIWEMHPKGSEVVLCTTGMITLIQETEDGRQEKTILKPGQYAINQSGVWHTADVAGEATALFVTAGMGTQHRKR